VLDVAAVLDGAAVGFLLMSAWCWLTSLRSVVCGRRSSSWPTAKGTIRRARIVKKYDGEGREVWRHDLEYSYSANGRAYSGRRVRFGIPNSLLWLAPSDPSFRLFRTKARVAVRHSPRHPSISTLQTGVSPFVFVSFTAGAFLAWIGFWLLTSPRG
jgi:hypothetical protein